MWKTSQEGRIVVRLGKVDEMATVRINSINCGTVWTAPYEVDIKGRQGHVQSPG